MIIRGLVLPDIESPPDASRLLASYLATTDDDLYDLLHSGARWPEKLGADHRSMEIFAACRAFEDVETSPDILEAAISFAYLLYHWNLTAEAFRTLESIDVRLSEDQVGTEDDPLAAHEDPFYVAGLMCSHGCWHGDGDLERAILWFRRGLDRGDGLLFHGAVLGAIGLCLHRLRQTVAAGQTYEDSMDRLSAELEREQAEDEPIFHEDLHKQVQIFERQRIRLSAGEEPDAVMTKYGWAMYCTGRYEHWSPCGQQPWIPPLST